MDLRLHLPFDWDPKWLFPVLICMLLVLISLFGVFPNVLLGSQLVSAVAFHLDPTLYTTTKLIVSFVICLHHIEKIGIVNFTSKLDRKHPTPR